MKLAACFTVFGTEFLTEAVNNVIDLVDEVIVCYQTVSNTGTVQQFTWDHPSPKVTCIHYKTVSGIITKENERRKHQLMINKARELRCTHFYLSATDHFYMKDDFIRAKKEALDYDITFTAMYTYFKHPTWQLTPIEDYYMPFICRLTPRTKIVNQTRYPYVVDPSVRIAPYDKFKLLDIMTHHYSMVRVDVRAKFKNAAASVNWKADKISVFLDEFENYNIEENPGVTYFKGRRIKLVPNYFNL